MLGFDYQKISQQHVSIFSFSDSPMTLRILVNQGREGLQKFARQKIKLTENSMLSRSLKYSLIRMRIRRANVCTVPYRKHVFMLSFLILKLLSIMEAGWNFNSFLRQNLKTCRKNKLSRMNFKWYFAMTPMTPKESLSDHFPILNTFRQQIKVGRVDQTKKSRIHPNLPFTRK